MTRWVTEFTADHYRTEFTEAKRGTLPADDDDGVNPWLVPPDGRRLLLDVAARLERSGWNFDEPVAEDHGWHAVSATPADGRARFHLVVAPVEDEELPLNWYAIVDVSLGWWGATRVRRWALLNRLIEEARAALIAVGGRDLQEDDSDLVRHRPKLG